jgi:phospholipid/cholesterol/gamma-HCH transport system substrate-binding protein
MPTAHQITWAKIRVFAAAVAALSILIVLIYLLAGGSVLFQPKSRLYVYIPDAAGLYTGSTVRVNGIVVGKVESVSLSGSSLPDRVVRVALTIESDYLRDIPADSYAQLETATAIGDKYVNITRGRSAAFAQPNAEIPFREQQEFLKTLDVEQFTKQLETISALLDQIEEGKNPTGQLLLSDQLYNQVRTEIGGFEREIRTLRSPRNPVGKMLYTDEGYRRFVEPLMKIDQAIMAIQKTPLLAEDTAYNSLAAQLKELRGSIERFESAPFLQSDELYTSWSRALASFLLSVDQFDVNPLLTTSEMYDNLTGLTTQLRDFLHDFREDPQKFLRVRLFGPKKQN